MKKILRSTIAILLVLATVFAFTGCSSTSKAEAAVNGMFRTLKRLDFDAAEDYVDVNAFNLSELGNDIAGNTRLFMRYMFGKLDHKILSSKEIDNKTVEVTVEVKAVALGPVLVEYLGAMLKYNLSNIFGDEPSEEEKAEKAEEVMKEIIKSEDLKMTTTEVVIKVTEENGKWRVASEKSLIDAMFGGIASAIEDIAGLAINAAGLL